MVTLMQSCLQVKWAKLRIKITAFTTKAQNYPGQYACTELSRKTIRSQKIMQQPRETQCLHSGNGNSEKFSTYKWSCKISGFHSGADPSATSHLVVSFTKLVIVCPSCKHKSKIWICIQHTCSFLILIIRERQCELAIQWELYQYPTSIRVQQNYLSFSHSPISYWLNKQHTKHMTIKQSKPAISTSS